MTIAAEPRRPLTCEGLGIVVIGRNEGERLSRCLRSAASDVHRTVYVDSGSTDDSVAVARSLGATVVVLDLSRPFTAARARNAGWRELARLSPEIALVQFVDGDCELVDGWLDLARAFLFAHGDVAVACGRRREREPERSLFNRLCDQEWDTPVGEALECGGDSLVRLAALADVGGFRPELIAGEEPELCVRLRERGWRIWRLDADMTRHDAAMIRPRQWWSRTMRGGHAFAEVSRLHRGSPHGIWRPAFRRALLWGGALPGLILAGALVHPLSLLGAAAYPLQVCRLAARGGVLSRESWLLASLLVAGKFAEFQGIVTFYKRLAIGRDPALIEYK